MVGPNILVLTLLLFYAYPCITNIDTPLPTIIQQNIAMQKAMEEVKRSHASCQVNDEFNTQNGLSTSLMNDLLLKSPVFVFYEGNASQLGLSKGSYKLFSI